MNILIVGSEGFIGSHCASHFLSKDHQVIGLDLFEQSTGHYRYIKVSRLSPEFDEIFEKESFDLVINAAGSGNVPYSMQHPVSDFEANCLDTIRILDAIRKHHQHAKYIHLSSAAVYGNPEKLPVKEEDRLQPLSAYGWHKLMSEHLCREYTQIYSLKTAILRPFSVYGEGLKKQLFWDLFQKSKQGTSVSLIGTGKESRDFIHVSDLAKAIDCISEKSPLNGEAYNLASGRETTIADAVSTFFQAMQLKPSLEFNGVTRSGDPLNWRADISRLSHLGFVPAVDLNSGMQRVAKWMRSIQ